MSNDGARLNIDYNTKTRLTPAGSKTIMPMIVGGQKIIPKELIKPKAPKRKPVKKKPVKKPVKPKKKKPVKK